MSAAATISLRPLNTGELLDRTITLYRKHFLLFVGIMALPNVFLLGIVTVVAVLVFGMSKADGGAAAIGLGLVMIVMIVVAGLGYWIAYVLAQGATTFAVSEIYLGRRAGILQSYEVVKFKLLRLIGMSLLLAVAMGAGLLLCVIPGFWVILRTALSIPAAVIEDLQIIPAIERSIRLTTGSWVRVLLVYFLATALNYAAAAVFQYPFDIAATLAGSEGAVAVTFQLLSMLGAVIAGTLTGPIAAIALALIYYDERVRKEGFDLQYMMAALDSVAPPAAGTPPEGTMPPSPPETPPPIG